MSIPIYPKSITGFLPYLSLHDPRNKDKTEGKMLSMKDLLIRIKLACGCTFVFILSASSLLLLL